MGAQKRFIEDSEIDEWKLMMMRPVLAGKINSLSEIRDNWTLAELYDFCEMMDYQEDIEEESYEKSKQQ